MEFLKKLGVIKVTTIIGAGLVIVALVIFLIFEMSTGVLTPIYSKLSPEDASLISAKLQSMGIKYETNAELNEISVASDKVLMLRMLFAQEGIPASGNIVGYEIFDRDDALGTSQFVYNVNLVRALEGELARTIGSLNQIDNVRVHIVMPKKELFSKVGSEPSASVVLKMKGNQILSKPEISAIANLVATAIPGLKIENITIIDNLGRPLKLGAEETGTATLTSTAMEFQLSIENRLKQEIEELVERSVGVGKIKASVAAEIDFDREIINSETYDPNAQVVRSKKVTEEKESELQPNSNVSVSSNIPNTSNASANGSRDKSKSDEVTNYEISKTISNKVIENGRVKKLSIAVLVDGNYEINAKTNEVKYTERQQVELDKIKALIVSGVGINIARGDNVEVINMRFASDFATLPQQSGMFDFLKNDLQNIIQTVVIGFVLILIVLLVVRPIVLRALEKVQESIEDKETQSMVTNLEKEVKSGTAAPEVEVKQVAPEEMINFSLPEDKRRVNMIKQFNEIVDKHPEEAISIIRNWLYQE